MSTHAGPNRASADRATADTGARGSSRRAAEKTGLRPSQWPVIQRCGTDTSCGCTQREQAEGASGHVQRATSTPGAPLPTAAKSKMQQAFSFNFDAVRVHTDAAANATATALGARAMTTGADIVFAAGEYAPGTAGGDHLLAHELAHVVQQSQGLVSKSIDGGPNDHLERAAHQAADRATPAAEHEADGAARTVATGGAVPKLSRQPLAIARQPTTPAAPAATTVPITSTADAVAVRQNAQDFVNNIAAKYGTDSGHTQLKGSLSWTPANGRIASITSTWSVAENYPSPFTGPGSSISATEMAACRALSDRIKQHEDRHAAIEKTQRERFLSTFVGSAEAGADARVDTLDCQVGQAQRAHDCAEGKITLDANNKLSVSGVDHPEYIGTNCAAQFRTGGCP
ncbi:DUF4157 domain-containing protein [Mycolicibacterium sp. lyk4-40-TYG-92]|uniref:eCIS core domain-containing protein n=1 Tax=Mycolicibacterium sp. lyk4-40-TYG-92 TaxID=3040295 RepID=UPI00254B8014|nr:DUF4157 domain-containing protein [Mycolicibacterium sp. lyk4-40-TYG-92]